ncbi:hypothetical protein HNR16_000954 [Pseudoclavibacter chungangensis]|uniref:thioesterase family protein n=1 Tax=Pseudoclavibacter chungangensis TaxID=587635 RepID=UPI00181F94B7|nr:thioesterase family protein [Pseudoclavibacter chungangensis]NYJ66166.1 hypothetical protein [Pseudoclavibacter chungangensis]
MDEACYRRTGPGTYESTPSARGAWTPDEQHMAAATGLVVEALVEHARTDPAKRIARISLDILGTIHMGDVELATHVIRPGRRIELVETTLRTRGRTSIVARAWRLAVADTSSVAGTPVAPMPGPAHAEPLAFDEWPDGYVQSIEARTLPGRVPGSARVWLRGTLPIIEGTPTSQLARILALADVANGIAPRSTPSDGPVTFPNVDLQLHLFRDPVGAWLGLDTLQTFGPSGTGLTSSTMHDERGPFGRIEQALLVLPGGHA